MRHDHSLNRAESVGRIRDGLWADGWRARLYRAARRSGLILGVAVVSLLAGSAAAQLPDPPDGASASEGWVNWAFVTLATVVTIGLSAWLHRIHQDAQELKREVKHELGAFRSDLTDLRRELADDITAAVSRLHEDLSAVRAALTAIQEALQRHALTNTDHEVRIRTIEHRLEKIGGMVDELRVARGGGAAGA